VAIRSNYKGIIQAIKLKSGVNKVYPSNFWGIIEALLDLNGGGGINIIYPPNMPPTNGNDGDMIGIPNADGDWFIYIWADGSWQPIHVLTTDVLPNPPGGMPGRSGETRRPIYTPDGEELTNQQDINWYLYSNLGSAAKPDMVYYGKTPPNTAPEGAIFTDEDSLKQFIHQGGGVWVEVTHWNGDGEVQEEEPWIHIDEVRVLRQYSGASLGSDNYVAKILMYEVHYNDHYASDIGYEWEIDENGDGNWVAYDPVTDPNASTDWLDSGRYIYYLWSPEAGSGSPPMDSAHPHPCAKLRVKMTNTWPEKGVTGESEWFEFWLAKEQNPAASYPYQPPSVCP